jgi:hypothetical protein
MAAAARARHSFDACRRDLAAAVNAAAVAGEQMRDLPLGALLLEELHCAFFIGRRLVRIAQTHSPVP